MSYLLDKKIKRKKFLYAVFFVIVLFVLFYFRTNVFSNLSLLSHVIFRPVLVLGRNFGEKFSNLSLFIASKNFLQLENTDLKSQLNEERIRILNYNSILAENINLKEILGRKNEKVLMTLASILTKPNQSLYDTLIIDAGSKEGVQTGDMVFVLGNVPIGRVVNVYLNSSKVILFSNNGEKTQALISDKDIFMEVVGRGGGNFEIIVPAEITLTKGDQIILPGIVPYVLAIIETVISDPRDPFVKALLVSPVNIQELKFVQVEKQE